MEVVIGEVVPCILMVLMEASTIALTIMASTVISKGLSPLVFVVYTNALSSIFLLPYNSFILRTHLNKEELFPRLLLLGFLGITMAQNLAYVGLSYSSPIVACGMGNLIPSLSFLLAIFSRRTKVDLKNWGSRAKLLGTMISIAGAVSLTLYRGPAINHTPAHLQLAPRLFLFSSTNEHWVLGAIFFAAASLSFSIWNIIQVGTLEKYPEVMAVASCYSLTGTAQSALLSMIIERNPNAWKLNFDMGLLVIVLTALFGSIIRSNVQMWCIQRKGQFYVTMFKPLGIPIASMCGCIFFANTFHYGSIMGAAVTGVGYYTMMWGQIREDETRTGCGDLMEVKAPLLQEEQV